MGAGESASTRVGANDADRRSIVLLGASNLTRCLRVVLNQAEGAWGAPLEVFAALGHGRSYGQKSCVLGRGLPGILECGIWPALDKSPRGNVAALLTDVGNDIVYGVPPATILEWIAECLRRLAIIQARVVVTLLPLENICALPPWRFRLLRNCLFPGCRLSFAEALDRAAVVQEGLTDLAAHFGATIVQPRASWYRFDPIHLSRHAWPEAWREILVSWKDAASSVPRIQRKARSALYFLSLWPEQQRLFGIQQRFVQPCGTLRDGTTIALY